jgi:uncharacterized protein (DUF736 family)
VKKNLKVFFIILDLAFSCSFKNDTLSHVNKIFEQHIVSILRVKVKMESVCFSEKFGKLLPDYTVSYGGQYIPTTWETEIMNMDLIYLVCKLR